MKNQILLLVMAITIVFFATSCNQPQQQTISFTEFSKKADTVIAVVVYHPILKNRIGCNDTLIPTKFINGQPVGQKVVGWTIDTLSIPANARVNITKQDMKDHTTISPSGSSDGSSKGESSLSSNTGSNSSNGAFHSGRFPWWLLVGALVVILLLLLLFRHWPDRSETHTFNHNFFHNFPESKSPDSPVQKEVQKEVREDRIFVIGGLGLPAESLFRGQVQNHNGVQNIFNVHGNGNHVTIQTNYPIEPKKDEPKQP